MVGILISYVLRGYVYFCEIHTNNNTVLQGELFVVSRVLLPKQNRLKQPRVIAATGLGVQHQQSLSYGSL
jgi:hypothetical protein